MNITLSPANFPWIPITFAQSMQRHSFLDYIRLVFQYQRELRLLILEHLMRNVFLIQPDLSDGEETIPYASLFNAIETNLRNLVATDIPQGMQVFNQIWRGWTMDERPLDYTDVNRWFLTIQLMNSLLLAMQPQNLTTRFFVLGYELPEQTIGITWQFPTHPFIGYIAVYFNNRNFTADSFDNVPYTADSFNNIIRTEEIDMLNP